MPKKSDTIKATSVSDRIRVAILSTLEDILVSVNSILTSITGTNLSLNSVSYTDAASHDTTIGKNTVMITCKTGVEEINGIVRPAGVYTYQPTGKDKNNVISVNANSGQIIIDEL